ncbi:MAG: clostripain-related cysteine peptidase [Elusimicrobia bacterium]|nr:clostripain-related cysteine peptidase [Elusimicrobiota bacterium]
MMKSIAAFFCLVLFRGLPLLAAPANEFDLESLDASAIRSSAAVIPTPAPHFGGTPSGRFTHRWTPPQRFPLRFEKSAGPAAQPQCAALKDWTVMIFVNGKNNLETSALQDVNQMELVGTTAKVNIAVELGRMKGQKEGDDATDGDWTGARRYLIAKDNDLTHIASPVIEYRKKADMGSWKELANFVKWARVRFPARRYALIIWDHGNGWKPVDPANAPDFANISKGFSLDDDTGHEISTLQLGAALKDAGKVDLFMADGCNMQMASVAYEYRNYADVMVASEETEPGEVLRYAQFLGKLNERPEAGPEEVAGHIVRAYRDYFLGGGSTEEINVTQSAVRLGKLSELREKLDNWASLAIVSNEKEVFASAKKTCKAYDDPEYKDLYHFISLVTAATKNAALRDSGAGLLSFLKSEVVLENWGLDPNSNGMSIYVPDVYDPLYDKLAWSRDGVWDDFARLMATLPPSAPPATQAQKHHRR